MAAKPDAALKHLQKDPVLLNLIKTLPPFHSRPETDLYYTLLRSVVGQQLSVKAAATIFSRFIALYPDNYPDATTLMLLPDEQLRACGLSGQKARYVRAVAEYKLQGQLEPELIAHLPDEELILHLTKINGVGRWTAEMLLMFALERPDVFPLDDLGIKNAMVKQYEISGETRELKIAMAAIAENWRPFRTIACRYLWKSLDNLPG